VNTCAIIVAAGKGVRIGASTEKAFLPLAGRPLFTHSLRTFDGMPEIGSAVLVVSAGRLEQARTMLEQQGPWRMRIEVASGGAERQDSVARGVQCVPAAAELIVVHDAARPLVSGACVRACLEAAAAHGAAIAAVPARDSIKIVEDGCTIARSIDRTTVWLAQTPQVFAAALLRRAIAAARAGDTIATDESVLVERLGIPVRVVEGEARNIKITVPGDLSWAEWLLRAPQQV
jgi:2-C-methyl-D-erythritol 4-phosphate cytidylyltransferase